MSIILIISAIFFLFFFIFLFLRTSIKNKLLSKVHMEIRGRYVSRVLSECIFHTVGQGAMFHRIWVLIWNGKMEVYNLTWT